MSNKKKSEDRKRNNWITIRLKDKELHRLNSYCAVSGRKRSDVVRAALTIYLTNFIDDFL